MESSNLLLPKVGRSLASHELRDSSDSRSKKRVDANMISTSYNIDDSLAYVRVGLLLLMSYYMRPKQVFVRCEPLPPRDVGEDGR
jgi:hypothetical protein